MNFNDICPQYLSEHIAWIQQQIRDNNASVNLFSFLQVARLLRFEDLGMCLSVFTPQSLPSLS